MSWWCEFTVFSWLFSHYNRLFGETVNWRFPIPEKAVSMIAALKYFEKIILNSLVGMMAIVVTLATFELGWVIVKDVITPPFFLLELHELLDIFGLFLLILIGIELLDTIKSYMTEHKLHVEIVLVVALIAVSRKVIILDTEKLSALSLLGIGAIILALGIGYYLVKLSHGKSDKADGV
jgi:uncharacterized membrane protein (DUF373 family)